MERLKRLKREADEQRAAAIQRQNAEAEEHCAIGRKWAMESAGWEDLERAHHIATHGWYKDERFDRHVPLKGTWPRNRFVMGVDQVYRSVVG